MRNLKRALSLALASVMVLGLMVVGSGASYADVTSEENQEAIEVLQAVGVMVGDDEGNFNPDKNVTRNEMAVVMSNLLDLKVEDFNAADIPFTDVPSWAVSYVAACYADGITSGTSATTYGGSNTVTAAQAALMMMKALGYFQYQGDFEQDWTLATIKKGSEIGIFDGITVDRTSPLTRNDVAQMALNALKSNMVTFTGEVGIEIPTANGNVVVGYNPEYTARTSANSKYNQISAGTTDIASNNQYFVQLGEELYNGDLKLRTGATDVFGRPANYWEYDGKEIGTYVNYDLLMEEYTTEVTGKDLYDLLGSSTIKDYDLTVVIDGVSDSKINPAVFAAADMNKNNKDGVGDTGNGVLTQVFVDTADKQIVISIINTYLAIADDDYNEKKDEASFDVYGLYEDDGEYIKRTDDKYNNDENMPVDNDDINVEDVLEGDAFLATIADGAIQTLTPAEIVSDVEITAFKIGSNVTVDGTKYEYASAAEYDVEVLDKYTGNGTTNLKDITYNVYLDSYGYAIGVDEVNAPNNYVFITGADEGTSNLSSKTIKANAIFIDGTMATIDVNTSKSDAIDDDALVNKWYTYTVNSSDVYTLKAVATSMAPVGGETPDVAQASNDNTDGTIDKKNVSLSGDIYHGYTNVYGNDASVYLIASVKEITASKPAGEAVIIDDVDSVVTGVKNTNITVWDDADVKSELTSTATAANTTSGTYVLYKDNGYIIAAVVVGEDAAASKNLVYVSSSSVSQEAYDKAADEWTWTRTVIMNGEETELVEVSDSLTYLDRLAQYGWYQVSLNAEGEVIGYKTAAAALDETNGNAKEYLTDYEYIELSVNKYDTVLYTEPFTATAPWMRGSVLYVTRSDESGFFVAEDANIVLFQTNKNKEEVTFEVGADELENIVDKLNKDYNNNFDYTISAVIEDGAATTVIIRDEMNNYQRPTGDVNAEDYFVDRTGYSLSILYYKDAAHDEDTLLSVILDYLTENGYSEFDITYSAPNYSIKCTDRNNVTRTFTWDATSDSDDAIKVIIDGKGELVDPDAKLNTVIDNGTYAKRTKADGTLMAYGSLKNAKFANAGDGASYETGYYEVEVERNSANVDTLYMKPGMATELEVTGGDWTNKSVTADNSFFIDNTNRTVSNDKKTLTVEIVAPSTLDDDVTVTLTVADLK